MMTKDNEIVFEGEDGSITRLTPADIPGTFSGTVQVSKLSRCIALPSTYRAVFVNAETGDALSNPMSPEEAERLPNEGE